MSIHNYGKMLRKTKQNFLNAKIPENNKKLVKDFVRFCIAQNIGKARIIRIYQLMKQVCFWIEKDLDKLEEDDVLDLLETINTGDYSEWTKNTYKSCIKKFLRWTKKHVGAKLDFQDLIKLSTKNKTSKIPEELLTKQEVMAMVEEADNPRDRAFLMMLHESGVRIRE